MTEFSELIESIDPEDFVSDLGCEYRKTHGRSGQQLNIKECPRCGGASWKVFLNAETGLGNCFHGACVGQPGFSLYSFAFNTLKSKYDTMKLIEAHAGKMGWRPKAKHKVEQERDWGEESLRIPKSIELPYKGKVLKYLSDRGFTKETVEYFQLRYCSKGSYAYRTDKGFRDQDYSGRILIPIFDLSGNLVSFQGRDITGRAEKKYLFPPGLPGTSFYLYNGHNAVGRESIVINEGVFDVAAVYQAFIEDPSLRDITAIGTFGKVLSMGRKDGMDQLGALMSLKVQGLKNICMMWDSEPSTIRSMIGTAEKLSGYGFNTTVALLPPGCDPNEASALEVRSAYRRAVNVSRKSDLLKFKMRFA